MRLSYLIPFLLSSSGALATSETPLMVVRYNQPRVLYQRQLYNAVSRAVAIKPSVRFTVISYDPATIDAGRVSQQTESFIHDLNSIGIPGERISRRNETVRDSQTHEIYLYVD